MLYHFFPKLKAYKGVPENSTHLNLLVNYIRDVYASTKQCLKSLQNNKEIIFNLLWTLFKSNELIYRKCYGTKKHKCIRFNSGKIKEDNKEDEYFCIQNQYLDFNGKKFGEAVTAAAIWKF